jgi:predicted outer membrane repeat protein
MKREFIILLVLVLSTVSVASGRTWYIKADGTGDAPTVQAGIDSAAVGDTVMLADGTFRGDGNRDITYSGKAIAVLSESDDPELCIIDCEGSEVDSHRGFAFGHGDGPDAVLRGITIANGAWFTGGGGGGGIYCGGGSPILVNLVLLENRAELSGGGIECRDGAAPTLLNARVVNNVAENGAGGGIYWEQGCSPLIADVVFEGNDGASTGGAICGEYYCERTLSDCRFTGNTARKGGAAAFCCSDCTFEDCHFVENSASGADGGGALFLLDGAPVIIRCEFISNSSNSRGGAIMAYYSAVTLQSCVLVANCCAGQGGGMSCDGVECECSVYSCTFAQNLTTAGSEAAAGVICENYAQLSMVNSIIVYSPNGAALSCDIGSQAHLACCDVFGNTGGDWVDCVADQLGVEGNFSANPKFCDLAATDLTLEDCSPCLPGQHPDGYDCAGIIGALGSGCPCGTAAEPTTWGSIKSMYY